MKACGKCGVKKPLTEFHRCRRAKDGLQHRCKECLTAHVRRHMKTAKARATKARYWKIYRLLPHVRAARKRYEQTPAARSFRKRRNDAYRARPEVKIIIRAAHIRRTYGLSQAAYAAMIARQKGACAICRLKKKISIDHDHKSGRVRGLLCITCNTAIGSFHENPALLEASKKYLQGASK